MERLKVIFLCGKNDYNGRRSRYAKQVHACIGAM